MKTKALNKVFDSLRLPFSFLPRARPLMAVLVATAATLAFGAIEIERPSLPRIEVDKTGSLIDISATLVGYDANTMTLSGPVTGTDVTQGWNFFTIAPKSGYVWRTTGLGDAIGFNWRIVSPTGVHDADDLAVDWETAALTGAGGVSTEGALKCAYVADNSRALSLNGVTFALGGNVPTALGGADNVKLAGGFQQLIGWFGNPGEQANSDFLLMARSGYLTSAAKATVTLNNLTAGNRYLVQILCHEGTNPDLRMSADDADWRCLGGTGDCCGKYGCSFVGRFTATGSSFAFPLRSEGRMVVNAIQVRDLGPAPAAKTARVPVGSPSLVYDGTALRGVADGVGYTVANAKATDAGTYGATATLDAGYAWADGHASASRAVSFTIHPADNAITYFRPLSFAADAPKPNDPMIRVTGGTPVFRYCSDEAGQHEVAMNGSEQPGTYYVFATVPAGNYKSVSTSGVVTVKPAGWKGPKVAIVGDSYSTFAGTPGNGAIHYPGTKNDILELTQTWWWQVIEGISGASLEIDLAYAGSELKGGKNISGVSFVDRINKTGLGTLGADDIILVCGGLNDVMLWVDAGIPVSTETMYDHADTVLKLINAKYPSVKRKIFVGQNLLQNYNNKGTNYLVPIRQACEDNEWVFVNTASVLGPQGYAPNMHWGIDAARMVSRQVLGVYDDCEKNGYPADRATQAQLPTVKTGLVYTGEEQTGVSGGKGCTLEGTLKATDAGDYTATAVLNSGCTWADGTTAARRTLTWSIAKATNEWVQKPAMSKTMWALDYAGTVTVSSGSSKWGAPIATYATGNLPKTAGTYRNAFTVAEAKNWTGLAFEIPFTVNAAGGETDPDIVAKPTLAKTKFDFSGNPVDVTAQLSSTANVTLSGDTVRTEAGSYTLIVSPARGYAWDDGTTAALSFAWRIVKPTNAKWTKSNYDPKTWTSSANNLVKNRTPTTSQNADKAARLVDGVLPGETFDANKVVVFNAATYSIEWTFDASVKIDRINFFSRSAMSFGEAMIHAKGVLVKYEGETEWTNLEVADEGGVWSCADGTTARLLSVTEEGGLCEGVVGLRLEMFGNTDLQKLGLTPYSFKSSSSLVEVEVIGSSGDEPVTPKATVPTAKAGLVYTGAAQTGVAAGTGFTLEGNAATDAGNYTATAKLASGYEWADGSTSDKSIAWSIAQATPKITGTLALAGWTEGDAPRMPSGLATDFGTLVYAYYADETCTRAMSAPTAATPAGTYYVRGEIAADKNWTAAVSAALAFTVAEKGEEPPPEPPSGDIKPGDEIDINGSFDAAGSSISDNNGAFGNIGTGGATTPKWMGDGKLVIGGTSIGYGVPPSFVVGTYAMAFQNNSVISQKVDIAASGCYRISYRYMRRNWAQDNFADSHRVDVLVNGEVKATNSGNTDKSAIKTYSSTIRLEKGQVTLAIQTTAKLGQTTFVDDVKLVCLSLDSAAKKTVAVGESFDLNGGFEDFSQIENSKNYGSCSQGFASTDKWTGSFVLAKLNSDYGNVTGDFAGSYCAIVQGGGTMEQRVYVPQAGTYALAFDYRRRQEGSAGTHHAVAVQADGAEVAALSGNTSTAKRNFSCELRLTAGWHTLGLKGTPSAGLDQSTFVDGLTLTCTALEEPPAEEDRPKVDGEEVDPSKLADVVSGQAVALPKGWKIEGQMIKNAFGETVATYPAYYDIVSGEGGTYELRLNDTAMPVLDAEGEDEPFKVEAGEGTVKFVLKGVEEKLWYGVKSAEALADEFQPTGKLEKGADLKTDKTISVERDSQDAVRFYRLYATDIAPAVKE